LLLSFNSCQTSNKVFKVYNYDEIETNGEEYLLLKSLMGKKLQLGILVKIMSKQGISLLQLLKRILFGRRNL